MSTLPYQVLHIPKGNGRFRTIYNPGPELRSALRKCWTMIKDTMMASCDYRVCHGFMPGRSPSTNASYHCGYQYTLSMDLHDFFDTVTEAMLLPHVPSHVLQACLIEGAPRQGLPTSPMLANIAASAMDQVISQYVRALDGSYTRYADDLTVSVQTREQVDTVADFLAEAVDQSGFVINKKKTRIHSSKAGRRVITGLAVDTDVYLPRRVRRKARAAKHQGHLGSHNGLLNWCHEPAYICPICWTRRNHTFAMGLNQHFRIWPEAWEEAVKREHPGRYHTGRYRHIDPFDVQQHLQKLVQVRGGIKDYAPMYEEIRSQFVQANMVGGL